MVFNLSDDGSLNLAETAVHNPMGESRGLDRAYAGMFARNLRQQGFAEVIQQQVSAEPEPEPSEAAPAPDNVRSQMADSPDEQTAESVTEPSDALANDLGTDVAAQTVEPFHTEDLGDKRPSSSLGYQETLERLRGVVQDLPDVQRESLLSAINQAEEQMASDPDMPLNSSTGTVAAGAFIQDAIAQNDPELDQQLTQSLETQRDSPTIEQFRNWYRAARTLGRSDQDLADIEAMGKSAKAGELSNLASSDAQQMAADLSVFEQQQELGSSILNHARRFLGNLEAAGLVQRDENGTIEARGRQYTVRQTPKGLSVVKNDQSAGVLENSEGDIVQVANLTEADKQNWETSASRSPRNLRSLYQKRRQRQPSVKSQAKEAPGVEL